MSNAFVSRGFAALLLLAPAFAPAAVFINEIHYDDSDSPTAGDTNERVEVVATAGEDLSLYDIVLYNGNSPSAAVTYATNALPTGSLVACGATVRFGTITYAVNGLQNGPSDGLALVLRSNSSVIQFLSYEGAITASNGPASGMVSTNIPVAESNSTVEGTSLQLGGSNGTAYGDFSWNASATATPGSCNNSQTFGTATDDPPTVQSSVPANMAANVPFDTTISITFSEPVDVSGTWFNFSCTGGAPTLTASASPATTFTLTPSAPIGYNKGCDLTVLKDQVHDRDGNADAMAADAFIGFETEADNPPEVVLPTTPPDKATDVVRSANLSVTFNEPVNATAASFAVRCPAVPATPLPFVLTSADDTTFTLNPNADLPAATVCELFVNRLQVTDRDGTAHNPDADTISEFTTAGLVPPSVISTVPIKNATDFPPAGDLQVVFDESVTLSAGAFSLVCVQSTGISLGHSSSGSSFVIDTGTTLVAGDSCTLTVEADAVVDGDGQHPSSDEVVAFSVLPDSAPTIQSTFPVDGAVNVATGSDLTVTFSEAVNVTATAFVVECPTGASLPYTTSSADQISYTINPDADLPADTDCTLTIVREQVSDLDGSADLLVSGLVVDFTTSAGVAGYYERVDTSSCRALRATLHGTIDDHTSYPYSAGTTDTFDIVEAADEDPDQPGMILDVYENKKFLKGSERADSTCTGRFNREHTWPKSLGFPSETGDLGLPNAPHTDGHMLYASNCTYNSTRGNNPYRTCATPASCGTEATVANYGFGGVAGQHNLFTSSFYDTWSKRRGDVARAVLYMDFRYEGGTNSKTGQSEPDLVLTYGDDTGTPGSLGTLLDWHTNDPPSNPAPGASQLDNIEPIRNDVVESYQGNRNPLIDHPEWAPMLFAAPCNGPVVVAVDDDFSLTQDTTLTAAAPGVLRDDHNGSNKNGAGLSANIVTPASHGTALITNASTGAFTYTPTSGYCGSDSFVYQATNGSATDQGIAHLSVTCATPAVAVADSFNVIEDSGSNVLAVLSNDTGNPKFVVSVTQPAGGSVTIGAGGANVSLTPNLNACASTSFDYTLNGGSSATVSISMTCVNDAPTFSSSPVTTATEDSAYTYNVTTADVDAGASLTLTAPTKPAWLTLSATNGNGTLSGTPTNADVGVHNVTLRVSDGIAPAVDQAFTVTVSNSNDAPTFTSSAITTATEDTLYSYSVTTADVDTGAALTLTAPTKPAWLTLSATNGNGTLSGTPTNAEVGVHNVTLRLSDGIAPAVDQVFTITVSNTNDAPTASDATFTLAENSAATTVVGTVTANDPDAGTTLSYSITAGNGSGAFAMSGNQVVVANAAPLDFETTPQFVLTVTVSDGSLTDTATITVNLENMLANANDDHFTHVVEDSAAASLDVFANDVPEGGTPFVISSAGPAQHGTVTFNFGGLEYAPAANYCGPDSFNYTNGGDTATVTLEVQCVNDAPAFTSSPVTAATEDAAYNYSITTGDADTGAALTLTAPTLPGWLTFTPGANGTGTLSGTPTNAQVGTHNITLRVSDGIATPVDQEFTITVANVNDAPTASDASFSVAENSVANTVVGSVTASDPDAGASLTYSITGGNDSGAFAISGNQIVVVNGAILNFETTFDPYQLTISVSDGNLSDTAQITVTLTDADDPPVAQGSLPNRSAQEGVTILPFSVTNGFFHMDGGDSLTYSATGLPAGLTLDTVFGEIHGTPAAGSAAGSVYTVTITATDGGNQSAQQSFQYTVTAAPSGPHIFGNGFE